MREVYIVDGIRTPFLKAKGRPGPFWGSDLATQAGRELLLNIDLDPNLIDEVIIGSAMPGPDEANIARVIALRLGLSDKTKAYTVMRNCASGLQSIDCAYKDIALGRHNIVLAGGCDAMSHTPLMFNNKMINLFASLNSKMSPVKKILEVLKFRPGFLKPIIALERGLTDPIAAINMGQTAEELAYKFNISRQEMDEFSVQSHKKLSIAIENNILEEVKPIYDTKGNIYKSDDGLRKDSSAEKLSKLKPYFDKKYGTVTPANSSQVTDGAAMLLLASEDAVKKYNLKVIAKIKDISWAALDPTIMGLGPVYASTPLLINNNLSLNDIDYWEINEAFAAQVLGCIRAWDNQEFCINELGLKDKLGLLDQSRLNVNGGAIAMGHPIGASGARVALRAAKLLQQNNKKYSIASLCIGGGQGGAVLLEAA